MMLNEKDDAYATIFILFVLTLNFNIYGLRLNYEDTVIFVKVT